MIHIQQRDCSRFALDSLLSPTHSTQIFAYQAQHLYKDSILSLTIILVRLHRTPWLDVGEECALSLGAVRA